MIATSSVSIINVDDGTGISSSIVEYCISTSGTIPPGNPLTDGSGHPIVSNNGLVLTDGSWSSTLPEVPEGQYLWTRTRLIMSDGTFDMIYTVSRAGEDGAVGPQGISIVNSIPEYRLSDSSTTITGSGEGYSWSTTKPSVPAGKYIWQRNRNELSNNTTVYSDAVCDIVMSGLVFDVDRNSNAITSKVWESDITTKINQYDGSTGKSIRDRVTKTETDISGINTTISDIQTDVAGKADGSTVTTLTTKVNTISDTVDGHTQTIQSNTSRIDDAEDEIESTKTIASQTADKFTWLVKSGTSASNFTLTSRVAELISPQVVIKDPAGSATIITGGKIQANAITTAMLAANAIKSTNYSSGTSGSDVPANNYSTSGTFLDLTTGNIYTPNFAVNSVNGEAYLNGTIFASAGQIGNPGDAYWSIGTVYDSTWGDYAGLIANGNALIQSGKLTLSSDRLNSQNAGNYIQSGGYWYDFGLQVPDFTAGTNSHDQNFLYVRRIGHQPTDSTLDTDWSYLFRVDKAGNIYWNGHDISTGTFLPLGGGEVTGATTFDSTLTVKGKLTASSNVETNLMLQTNLGSTSSAQLTGAANAVVKPGVTGTLGVGNGGTGKSSWTANRLIYSSASNAISELGAGSSGQVLKSNGSSAPSWVNQSTLSVGSATKATQDGDGNVITDTYRALDNNQFDTINITDAQVGNLIVTGAGRFTNGLYGDLIGNVVGNVSGSAGSVANNLKIQLNGGTTEGTNQFTYDGSAVKNINITRSSIGLGAAADKAVDTSIAAGSSSANLPTSAAVSAFVEGKGYVTSSGVTSVRVQATSPVVSSQNTAQSSTLNTTISLADSYGDTKNPYGAKTANYVLAGPSSGSAAVPSFRKLVAADIPSLTKSKISDFPTTWALTDITGADDLKAIEGLSGTSGILKKTAANTWSLTTVVSGISIDDDVITVTKSDGTTQELSVNVTGQIVTKATVLSAADGTAVSQGSASVPVYFSNGVPVSANTIPTIALNGSNTTSPSFYAPTGAGTSGQYLKSNGSGAPTWATFSKLTVGLGNVDNTADANKNVLTATKFAAAQSVTLTGDTTGTASSQAGWSLVTTTKKITNSGRLASANVDNSNATYLNKITYFLATSSMTEGKPPTDAGILNFAWDNNKWGSQLAIMMNSTPHIYIRGNNNTSWDANWLTVLDSNNYNNYAPTKTGAGASGTWDISITGNAATATTASRVSGVAGTTNADRHVWFSDNGAETARNYDDDFKYNPSTNTLTVANVSGTATKANQDGDGNTISSTYAKLSGATFTGAVTGTSFAASSYIAVNSGNSGTAGGLALWSTDPTSYGIMLRTTANQGKHGYVQGEYAAYLTMSGDTASAAETRGWVFKNKMANKCVASISALGHAVFNGSVTVGGNATNTSGCRLIMNESTKSLDFIFN